MSAILGPWAGYLWIDSAEIGCSGPWQHQVRSPKAKSSSRNQDPEGPESSTLRAIFCSGPLGRAGNHRRREGFDDVADSPRRSLRDELLNEEIFDTLDDAHRKLALWRYDYNTVRPHSSLGNHGIASWLAGRELPLREVGFVFARPGFAEDYPILFPAPIRFSQPCSSISFDRSIGALPVARSEAEMQEFLIRAPRDWIFTSYREHALPLRLRELLLLSDRMRFHLDDAARALNLTPRTLMRRLEAEGTSFQDIKDGLRRDIAIRDLTQGDKTLEGVSQDIGFASVANFHRAFKRWTGMTPGAYRRDRQQG